MKKVEDGDSSTTKKYKTIVISDVHLGSRWSKVKEATKFLKKNSCETLILCGDIIDGWAILRGNKIKWRRRHTNFMKAILNISHTTKVIYLRGNHDDFLDRITPINFLNISVLSDYIYNSCGKKYYVIHGDIFDKVTSRISWLARLGDIGYATLLWINKFYNYRRSKKGLPYYSIAQEIKHKVKSSVSAISKFETNLANLAKEKGCDAVICGHIHKPEISLYNNIMYLNSGDWVESLSALVEDFDGNWSIYREHQDNSENQQTQSLKK